MKDKYAKLLKDLVDDEGIERLEKSIFHHGSQSVADPSEVYLPLMVVPRAILSWLVQNVRPMKVGEYKDLPCPGDPSMTMHVEKQDIDVYRAEFIKGGKIIHRFDKQGLPSIGGHLMVIGEDYGHLADPMDKQSGVFSLSETPKQPDEMSGRKPEDLVPLKDADPAILEDTNEPKMSAPENDSTPVIREVMNMADVSISSSDPESVKWAMSHANVRELTRVIGSLVDALVHKKMRKDAFDEELGKVSEKEVKEGDEANHPKPEADVTPREKDLADRKAAGRPKDDNAEAVDQANAHLDSMRETMRDKDTFKPPKIRTDQTGEVRQPPAEKDHRPKKIDKGEADAIKNPGKRMPEGEERQPPMKPDQRPIKKEEVTTKKRSVREALMKPYVSDAQRRWAHTPTGTKALGGKAAVHHWDEATRGKHLPERVSKDQGCASTDGRTVNKFEPGNPPVATPGGPQSEPGAGSSNSGAAPRHSPATSQPPPKPARVGAGLRRLLPSLALKAEMPAGAGIPKKPAMPVQPKPQVPASKNPAAAAAKQSQASARGRVAVPHTPGAQMPKNPAAKPAAPKPPGMIKSERGHVVTASEVYTPCSDCGKPEFIRGSDGTPQFSPCACFSAMQKDEEGRPTKFVTVLKKDDGTMSLHFSPTADRDSVKALLLTLKASLLLRKKYGDVS